MKSLLTSFVAVVAALIVFQPSEARATKVTLDGSGYYELGRKFKFYGGGVKQSGRYRRLGADYYHKAVIGMDWITNRSRSRSGYLSFEFWAMPYYGADKGVVLMTRGLDPLRGGSYYFEKARDGWAIFLDRRRFPEINLWELTGRRGWKFRDALSFRRKNIL